MTRQLVVYSGRNRPDLAPVYRLYEQLTGSPVRVEKIYHLDVEERLIAERAAPRADVLVTNSQLALEMVRHTGRAGPRRVTLIALLAAGLVTAPLSVSSTAVEFVVLRFGLGFCLGGVLPSLRAAIAEAVRGPEDEANLGAVYGLSVSAQSAGSLIAAPLASLIASLFGLPAMHLVSAALLIGTATAYTTATRGRVARASQPESRASIDTSAH